VAISVFVDCSVSSVTQTKATGATRNANYNELGSEGVVIFASYGFEH
jgi:hypothetical protein